MTYWKDNVVVFCCFINSIEFSLHSHKLCASYGAKAHSMLLINLTFAYVYDTHIYHNGSSFPLICFVTLIRRGHSSPEFPTLCSCNRCLLFLHHHHPTGAYSLIHLHKFIMQVTRYFIPPWCWIWHCECQNLPDPLSSLCVQNNSKFYFFLLCSCVVSSSHFH